MGASGASVEDVGLRAAGVGGSGASVAAYITWLPTCPGLHSCHWCPHVTADWHARQVACWQGQEAGGRPGGTSKAAPQS